ncbi:hypothetical protein [Paraburkholderia sp. JPY419]|uniref:hypothetical protein n=1 Tax=Paraburkholderia sp. JPY419 TaxID=667660 RepID=UPI003D243F89
MAKIKAETNAPVPAEPLDAVVERIREARTVIARLNADRARCDAVAQTGDTYAQEVKALRAERQQAQAMALADGIEADVAGIDARIASHAREHAAELDRAEAARQAIAILDTRIAAAEDGLGALLDEWLAHCETVLLAQLDAAEERYAQALEAIAGPVAQLEALAQMWEDLYHRALPAKGRSRLRENLRGVPALRVVWTHSALANPEIASRYDPGTYREGDGLRERFQPTWLAEDYEDFAQPEIAALRQTLHVDDVAARA